jgi:predicted nucleic acid-binding protein
VGTLVDSTVLVQFERACRRQATAEALATVSWRLARELGPDEEVAIAAITASELLQGVHRATSEHRARREAFVEAVLEAYPTLAFDLRCARIHSRVWADLVAAGADTGAHDRVIAATALAYGWRLATADARHFRNVHGLDVHGRLRPLHVELDLP